MGDSIGVCAGLDRRSGLVLEHDDKNLKSIFASHFDLTFLYIEKKDRVKS